MKIIKGVNIFYIIIVFFFGGVFLNSCKDDINSIEIPKNIIIYGDSRTNYDMHKIIVEKFMQFSPEYVFHTGDLVNDGTNQQDWDNFFDIASNMIQKTIFYSVLGNHEKNSSIYFEIFDFPGNERYFYKIIGNYIYFFLDSNTFEIGNEQFVWLEDLLKNSIYDKYKKIIISHHPPYSTGPHGDELNMKKKMVPLFEKYNIVAHFSGHEHSYERSQVNNINYIVTGGGGAPVYEQKSFSQNSLIYKAEYHFCYLKQYNDYLDVKVLSKDLNIIDEFIIK